MPNGTNPDLLLTPGQMKELATEVVEAIPADLYRKHAAVLVSEKKVLRLAVREAFGYSWIAYIAEWQSVKDLGACFVEVRFQEPSDKADRLVVVGPMDPEEALEFVRVWHAAADFGLGVEAQFKFLQTPDGQVPLPQAAFRGFISY